MKIRIKLKIEFQNGQILYYSCFIEGCHIENEMDNNSYKSVIPIKTLVVMASDFNFFQKIDMTQVDQVKNEYLELKINPNANPKIVQKIIKNNIEEDETDLSMKFFEAEENLETIPINELNYAKNNNQYLVLKQISKEEINSLL